MKPLNTVDLTSMVDNPKLAGPELYRAFIAAAYSGISSVITVGGATMALIVPDPGFPPDLTE